MTKNTRKMRFLGSTAAIAMATILASAPAQAIIPNENTDSEAIVDTDGGVNGIGQFFRNDGSVCTGSLINPRTVLFAAHCVNDRPETDYGPVIQSAFSFDVNALPGLQAWFANGFNTDAASFVYNISQIQYDPRSLQNPAAAGFIEADIALATLDTPAADIPTWALLFSQLPDPGTIDGVNGTGYHVNISGFGGTGNAFDGPIDGIDFRRRAAENILGALASLDDINNALGESSSFFGPGGNSLPQNLYVIDFDSQDGNTGADFNILRDQALPNEGSTAGGDSGGPLILDAANNAITNEDLLIGTLSGGSRNLNVPFGALGTTSFYQPIFLYWQYIAATNPYRYVGAAEGDGAWEDASHWVSLLDPNYRIIDANGNIINGLPSTPELGLGGTEGDFGQVCAEGIITAFFGTSACTDLGTGETFDTSAPTEAVAAVGSAGVASNIGAVSLERIADSGAVTNNDGAAPALGTADNIITNSVGRVDVSLVAGDLAVNSDDSDTVTTSLGTNEEALIDFAVTGSDDSEASTQDGAVESELESFDNATFETEEDEVEALPAPTLDNGLPGATDFVPNNVNADIVNGVSGRFFDITLANAGTTTLSSTVEIDNLAVTGLAGLNIAAEGDLTSLIGVNQTGGSINVDGVLNSGGDYTIFTGVLSGTGTVAAPFVTNIAGTISPAGLGVIGTLDIAGNLILSSGSTYELDIDAAGNSDLITVSDPDGLGESGLASIGGNVLINPLGNFLFNDGDTFTILTADTGIDGVFETDAFANSAVLNTEFIVTNGEMGGQVDLVFNVSDYADVVDATSDVQSAYAALLDNNRGAGLSTFGDIFSVTEFLNAQDLGTTLEGLAPLTETTQLSSGELVLNSVLAFNRSRLSNAFEDNRGGTVALNANAAQLASAVNFGAVRKLAYDENATAQGAAEGQSVNNLNSSFALYLSGGFLDGQGTTMPSVLSNGSDDIDGYFFAGGLEYLPSENSVFGVSISYTDVDGSVGAQALQTTSGELIHGSLYGAVKTQGGLIIDGQIGIGSYETSSRRNVSVGPNAFVLDSEDTSFVFTAEAGASKIIPIGIVDLTPRVAVNYATINFDDVSETGGQAALQIQRDTFNTFQTRGGITLNFNRDYTIRPWIRADYVHDFANRDDSFGANFVGGVGAFAPFAIAADDSDWVETAIGINMEFGGLTLGFSAETTIGRGDFENQSYQGSVTFKF